MSPGGGQDEHQARSREPESSGRTGEKGGGASARRSRTPAAEWAVAALGALLVFSAVGVMLFQALTQPNTPPRLEVTVDSIVDTGSGYLAQVRVRNRGQSTAAQLLIEGQLNSDTGSVETAQATISYVPAQSIRRAGLLFSRDPREFRLEVAPKGFDLP